MKDSIYIICDRNGVKDLRKSKPTLTSGQVAVRINVEIPVGYFDRFIPVATVKLPEPPPLTEISIEYDPEVVEPEAIQACR